MFGKGTRVKFKRGVLTSKPLPNGEMGESAIERGEQGTLLSVFPYRVILLDNGKEIKLHQSISLNDELEIITDGPTLRVMK